MLLKYELLALEFRSSFLYFFVCVFFLFVAYWPTIVSPFQSYILSLLFRSSCSLREHFEQFSFFFLPNTASTTQRERKKSFLKFNLHFAAAATKSCFASTFIECRRGVHSFFFAIFVIVCHIYFWGFAFCFYLPTYISYIFSIYFFKLLVENVEQGLARTYIWLSSDDAPEMGGSAGSALRNCATGNERRQKECRGEEQNKKKCSKLP